MTEQRSFSMKYRAPPLPIRHEKMSTLPNGFLSSLRQLFSILDRTNSGSISFDLFKQYFDQTSSPIDFLTQLEIESKSNDNFITFDLLINVIQRLLNSSKKIRQPVHRSMSNLSQHSKSNRNIPIIYRSSNGLNTSNPIYFERKQPTDFAMIRALKRFEHERDLLVQTSNTIERVQTYLNTCLNRMISKQKSYCQYLSTAETTGVAPEPMYNRDLVADLYKLANSLLEQVHTDVNTELKSKDDHIRRLETEKRILLKELIEMQQQYETVNPRKL